MSKRARKTLQKAANMTEAQTVTKDKLLSSTATGKPVEKQIDWGSGRAVKRKHSKQGEDGRSGDALTSTKIDDDDDDDDDDVRPNNKKSRAAASSSRERFMALSGIR